MRGGCFGDVMDVVVAVSVSQFLGIGVVDFGKDKGGERGGL
jgi:hypothetical protein